MDSKTSLIFSESYTRGTQSTKEELRLITLTSMRMNDEENSEFESHKTTIYNTVAKGCCTDLLD